MTFDWTPYRFLIIDSDDAFRKWTHELFDYVHVGTVASVRDPSEGLALLPKLRPDLVLLQLEIAPLKSPQVIRRLRDEEESPVPNVLVVLTTVDPMADPGLMRSCCFAGVENLVRKPTEMDPFLRRLASTLRAPQRFIATRTYFGPNRRKNLNPNYAGPERRKQPAVGYPEPRRAIRTCGPLVEESAPEAAPLQPAKGKPRIRDIGPLVDGAPQVKGVREGEGDPTPTTGGAKLVAGIDIDRLLQAHQLWLMSRGNQGQRLDLRGADLYGADLSGANLASANLREVNLADSICVQTIFEAADMRMADLSGSDMTEGNLAVANMRHVNLTLATLDGAVLRGTDLAGACLKNASTKGTDFSGVNMLGTDLSDTDLSQAFGLTQSQLNKVVGNEETRLPPGLSLPERE